MGFFENRVFTEKPSEWLTPEETNELIEQARNGDDEAVYTLWYKFERFVLWVIRKLQLRLERSRILDNDDLYQIAFEGFYKAIHYHDSEKSTFMSLVYLTVRQACLREYLRACSKAPDTVQSLDAPLHSLEHGELDNSLADFIPDETAERAFDTLLAEDIARLILREAQRLPNQLETRIVNECLYNGRSLTSLAEELDLSKQYISGCKDSAITNLRRRKSIQLVASEFYREEAATIRERSLEPYQLKGLASFKSDFTSVTELIVLRNTEQNNQGGN
jgi:RNA polymerase sigma factor (sigma-70 family)